MSEFEKLGEEAVEKFAEKEGFGGQQGGVDPNQQGQQGGVDPNQQGQGDPYANQSGAGDPGGNPEDPNQQGGQNW